MILYQSGILKQMVPKDYWKLYFYRKTYVTFTMVGITVRRRVHFLSTQS